MRGRRVIGISGSLIWSKTLMELIFNPCGEFRWSEGPVSLIHSPHLLVSAPGIFSDLLRFVQMLNREWDAESNRKLPHLFIPSKTATWVLSLQWKTCLWAKLQSLCLSLQWRTCPWAEHCWWWWWPAWNFLNKSAGMKFADVEKCRYSILVYTDPFGALNIVKKKICLIKKNYCSESQIDRSRTDI